MHLPVTVYQYDRRTKEYRFSHCLISSVPCSAPPTILNCSTGMGMLRDSLELLKAAMRAPAILLINGTRSKALNASGEEVASMPPVFETPVIHAFEMTCINIASCILHYRLRRDGALVFVGSNEEVNCLTCHVPETVCASYLKKHLATRAESIKKIIRDRRVVVEMGSRSCIYSLDTLHRRRMQVSVRGGHITNGDNATIGRFLDTVERGCEQLLVTFNQGRSMLASFEHPPTNGFIANLGKHVLYSKQENTFCLLSIHEGLVFSSGLGEEQRNAAKKILTDCVAQQRAAYSATPLPKNQEKDFQRMIEEEVEKRFAEKEAAAKAARELKVEEERKAEEIRKAEEERKAQAKQIQDKLDELTEMKVQMQKQKEDQLKEDLRRQAEFDEELKKLADKLRREAEITPQQIAVIPRQQQQAGTPTIDPNILMVCVVVLVVAVLVAIALAKDTPQQAPAQDNNMALFYVMQQVASIKAEQNLPALPAATVVVSSDDSPSVFGALGDFIRSAVCYAFFAFCIFMTGASVLKCVVHFNNNMKSVAMHRKQQRKVRD